MPFRDEMSERIRRARTMTEDNAYITLSEKKPLRLDGSRARRALQPYKKQP